MSHHDPLTTIPVEHRVRSILTIQTLSSLASDDGGPPGVGPAIDRLGRDDLFVFAYDERWCRPALAPVLDIRLTPPRDSVRVRVQGDWNFLAAGEAGSVFAFDPDTMMPGRWASPDSRGKLVPQIIRLDLDQEWPGIEHVPSTCPVDRPRYRLLDPVPLGFDQGYALGALAANGWVSGTTMCPHLVNLALCDEEGVNAYLQAIPSFFEDAPPSPQRRDRTAEQAAATGAYGSARKTILSSSCLAGFVAAAIGRGSESKHLPPCFFHAPRPFRLGLSCGLMDNDGSVSVSGAKQKPQLMASYSSQSLRLVQEFQHLLRTLGVRSRITSSNRRDGKISHVLNLSIVDLPRLEGFRLRHSGKAATWSNRPEVNALSGSAAKEDLIPISRDLSTRLRQGIGRRDPAARRLYAVLSDAKDRGSISRISAERIWAAMPPDFDHPHWPKFLMLVSDQSTTWRPITSIEAVPEAGPTCQVVLAGHCNFMTVDGIILGAVDGTG